MKLTSKKLVTIGFSIERILGGEKFMPEEKPAEMIDV